MSNLQNLHQIAASLTARIARLEAGNAPSGEEYEPVDHSSSEEDDDNTADPNVDKIRNLLKSIKTKPWYQDLLADHNKSKVYKALFKKIDGAIENGANITSDVIDRYLVYKETCDEVHTPENGVGAWTFIKFAF